MWAFPRGEIILGVLEMPGTPKKRKWTANHQISPEIGKNCQKKMKPTHFLPIPTMASGSFVEGNEGNMEEIGRNRGADAKLGKLVGESQVECHFAGFPQGRNYSRGIGDAWYPSKTKVVS